MEDPIKVAMCPILMSNQFFYFFFFTIYLLSQKYIPFLHFPCPSQKKPFMKETLVPFS